MRVNDGDAAVFFHIVNGHVGDEGGFAGAGFADGINMAAAITVFNAEGEGAVSEFGPA